MPLALASLSMLLLLLPVLPVTSIITITPIDNLHSSPIFLHRFGWCGAGWRARPCSAWRAWSWRACWPRSACTTSPWPPCSRSPTCPSPSSPPSAPPGPCPGSCSRELPMVVIVSTLCSTHTPPGCTAASATPSCWRCWRPRWTRCSPSPASPCPTSWSGPARSVTRRGGCLGRS